MRGRNIRDMIILEGIKDMTTDTSSTGRIDGTREGGLTGTEEATGGITDPGPVEITGPETTKIIEMTETKSNSSIIERLQRL